MNERAQDRSPPHCPVCSGALQVPYAEKDGFAFLRCSACGYVFCHPRPLQGARGAGDSADEGSDGIRADFYPQARSRARHGLLSAVRLMRYVYGRRALDLGCGGGFVANGFQRVFAREAVGLDTNPNAIEYAKAHYPDCTFHCGAFSDFTGGRLGLFDFVHSSEAIERAEDVEAYMTFLAEIAAPGAVVCITTPDIGHASVPQDVTRWSAFSPPAHMQFFTEETLARLFERHGFAVIKRVPDRGGYGLKMLFRKIV